MGCLSVRLSICLMLVLRGMLVIRHYKFAGVNTLNVGVEYKGYEEN